jgi:hypothetical protein
MIKKGDIGVNLNDAQGKLARVYHVGHEFVYYQFINSPIQGLCKIEDFWVLM